ncbi:MAG: nucleotidyltransferase family protein [Pirellulaceae bacterium]|nr:nucleotidyltransferase family protein [Pirellulaceae bacterium]
MLKPFSLDRMVEAVEAVRQRLLKATKALESAKLPYAVVGGNAVAAWVSRVDRAAVRNTQDVDILIRRQDFDAVRQALESVGFVYRHLHGVDCFLDHSEAHPRDAVHIIFAGEKVKPNDLAPTSSVTDIVQGDSYNVLSLEGLVRMKLTSFRDKDRTHLRDIIEIGLIDASWTSRFQPELASRLQQLLDDPDG